MPQLRCDSEQRLNFRAEKQASSAESVVQRLLPETITRQEEPLVSLVPKRKSKHAVQLLNTVGTIFFVSVDDHFGICIGIKAMALRFELRAQLRKVIDFSVENDPGVAIF